MPGLDAIGLGLGALTSIGRGIFGIKQGQLASQINPVYTPYQTSQYAKSRLGLAQQMFNGRMPGAANEESNLLSSQDQTVNNLAKGATDSSQFLSLASQAQGQTDNQLQTLQTKEAQSKYGMLNNLNNAYDAMTQEGDKVYADQLQKYQMDVAQKNALRSSSAQNIYGAGSDLSSFGMMLPQFFGKK